MSNIGSNGFTLEETKEMKKNALKAVRDYRETQPVEYKGHLYDFDEKSYQRILAAIYAVGDGGSIYWTTADNDVVNVTAFDLKNVIASAAARSNVLHQRYRELKDMIAEAKSVEEVEGIEWDLKNEDLQIQ